MKEPVQIVRDVVAWTLATLPEIQTVHDHPINENPGTLPDLAIEVLNIEEAVNPAGNAPATAHARSVGMSLDLAMSIVVPPLPADESAHSLWGMASRLIAARRTDRTLGHGLHSTPVRCQFPGTVPLNDGSEGLTMNVLLTVWSPP